jgi:hypothetical protein
LEIEIVRGQLLLSKKLSQNKKDKVDMNGNEARQHARDIKTVEKAVANAKVRNYDPPIKTANVLLGVSIYPDALSDQRLHDNEVYTSAYQEAKKP